MSHVIVRIRGKKAVKEYFDTKTKSWTTSKEKASVFTGNLGAWNELNHNGCPEAAAQILKDHNNKDYICMRENVDYYDGWPMPKT